MTYDDIGNITFKSDVGDYYYNPTRVHAIDSISDSQFQNRQDIEYNFFNKPVYIADEEDSLNYTYNVLDNRVKATLYGTGGLVKTTWYAGLYEKTVENSITKHYYYINSPDGPVALAIQTGGGTPEFYYLCKDHLGSITGVMNSSGNIVEEYSYDAWGRRRNPIDWSYSNVATPTYTQHGFTGHEHLDMFNLINMGGRIYDSEIARFLSPDPIIQDPYNILSYNRYSYCLNNPLKYTDPSGYEYDKFLRDWEREQRDDPGPDELYNNYVDYWGGYTQSVSDHNPLPTYHYNWDQGIYVNERGQEVTFNEVNNNYIQLVSDQTELISLGPGKPSIAIFVYDNPNSNAPYSLGRSEIIILVFGKMFSEYNMVQTAYYDDKPPVLDRGWDWNGGFYYDESQLETYSHPWYRRGSDFYFEDYPNAFKFKGEITLFGKNKTGWEAIQNMSWGYTINPNNVSHFFNPFYNPSEYHNSNIQRTLRNWNKP